MWSQVTNTGVGIWLMAAPTVFGYGKPAAASDYIVGPLVATFACIAIWEATRGVRWANVLLGAWVLVSPFIFGRPTAGMVNAVVCGLVIVGLACMGGHVQQRFGGGWTVLWRDTTVDPGGTS